MIDGREGADVVLGGPGDDILLGGPGVDCIVPGPGEDRLPDASDEDSVADADEGVSIDVQGDRCLLDALVGGGVLPEPEPEAEPPSDQGGLPEQDEEEGAGAPEDVTGRRGRRGIGPGPVSGPAGAGAFFVTASRFLRDAEDAARPSPPFVTVVTRSTEPRRGVVRMLLFCSRSVSGRVTLLAPRESDGRRRTLGVGNFDCEAGGTAVVRIRLSSAGIRLVQRAERVGLRATVLARDASGNRQTLNRRLLVTAPGGG